MPTKIICLDGLEIEDKNNAIEIVHKEGNYPKVTLEFSNLEEKI